MVFIVKTFYKYECVMQEQKKLSTRFHCLWCVSKKLYSTFGIKLKKLVCVMYMKDVLWW